MKRRATSIPRQAYGCSFILHGALLFCIFLLPLAWRGCRRMKADEQLMFVEFTVSIPPVVDAAEDVPEEIPEPEPDPGDIPEPVPDPPKPEPPKPEPPKPPKPKLEDIRQHNRVRHTAPPPKDKPLSAAEIEKLLKQGARISDTTSIPRDSQMALGAYYNHVMEQYHRVWRQPASSLPGMKVEASIRVAQNGGILSHRITKPSGSAAMDDSVTAALAAVKKLNALPAGVSGPREISITFELDR